MRRWRTWTAIGVAVAGLGVSAPAGAATFMPARSSTASSCTVGWGSLEKTATSTGRSSSPSLVNVRAGRHDCYDRLVLDIAGSGTVRVRYVAAVAHQGTGAPIPLRGGAFLEIITGPAYDVNTGAPTYAPADPCELVNVSGWQTFRQVAYGGSFEGATTIGLGVRARLPFRVFALSGPGNGSRLVIDVAPHW